MPNGRWDCGERMTWRTGRNRWGKGEKTTLKGAWGRRARAPAGVQACSVAQFAGLLLVPGTWRLPLAHCPTPLAIMHATLELRVRSVAPHTRCPRRPCQLPCRPCPHHLRFARSNRLPLPAPSRRLPICYRRGPLLMLLRESSRAGPRRAPLNNARVTAMRQG